MILNQHLLRNPFWGQPCEVQVREPLGESSEEDMTTIIALLLLNPPDDEEEEQEEEDALIILNRWVNNR